MILTGLETLHWLQFAARVFLYKTTLALDITDREISPSAPGFLLNLRLACLRSIEQFLETTLQMNAIQYEYLSIIDWLSLISSLGMIGKLALHVPPMPGWDSSELQLSRLFDTFRDQLCAQIPQSRDVQDSSEDVFERFRRITAVMKIAIKNVHGRGSPNGSTFEITSSSRQAVSILQELPPLNTNGSVVGGDQLPPPWKVNPRFDMSSGEFPWKFLMGAL